MSGVKKIVLQENGGTEQVTNEDLKQEGIGGQEEKPEKEKEENK